MHLLADNGLQKAVKASLWEVLIPRNNLLIYPHLKIILHSFTSFLLLLH